MNAGRKIVRDGLRSKMLRNALALVLIGLPCFAGGKPQRFYQAQEVPLLEVGDSAFTNVSVTNPCRKPIDVRITIYNGDGSGRYQSVETLKPFGQWTKQFNGDTTRSLLSGTVAQSNEQHCTVDVESELNYLGKESINTVVNVGHLLSDAISRPSRYSTREHQETEGLFVAINYSSEPKMISFCESALAADQSCPNWKDRTLKPHELISAPINPRTSYPYLITGDGVYASVVLTVEGRMKKFSSDSSISFAPQQ